MTTTTGAHPRHAWTWTSRTTRTCQKCSLAFTRDPHGPGWNWTARNGQTGNARTIAKLPECGSIR